MSPSFLASERFLMERLKIKKGDSHLFWRKNEKDTDYFCYFVFGVEF